MMLEQMPLEVQGEVQERPETIRVGGASAWGETVPSPRSARPAPLDLLFPQMLSVMGAQVGLLFGWAPSAQGGEVWHLFAHGGMPENFGKAGIARAWQSLPSLVLQTGGDLLSDDISKDPRFVGQIIRNMGLRGFAGTTLQAGETRLGSFILGFSGAVPDRDFFPRAAKIVTPFLTQRLAEHRRSLTSIGGPIESPIPLSGATTGRGIPDGFLNGMGGFIGREALLSDLFSRTCLLANVEVGYLLEQVGQGVGRLFMVAHKGMPEEKVRHLSTYGLPIRENGKEGPGEVSWQIPVRSSERPWGLLCFPGASPAEGHPEKSALIQAAWQTALDRLQWTLSARQRIEALTLANTLSQAAVAGLPLESCLADVAERFATMGGAQHASIFVFDEKRGLLRGMAATRNRGPAVREMEIALDANAPVALAARTKHPLAIEDARTDSRMDKKWLRLFNARAVLALPLLSKERVVGVLLLDDTRHFKRFTPQDVEMLNALTVPIATAMDHAMRHREAMRRADRLQAFSLSVVNLQEEEKRHIAHLLRQAGDKQWLETKRTIAQIEQGLVGGETAPEAKPSEVPRETAPPEDAPPMPPISTEIPAATEVPKPSALQQATPAIPQTASLRTQIRKLQAQAARTREEMQKAANDLHPAALDDAGLVPALRGYLDVFSKRMRITTHLQSPGIQRRLPPQIELSLYRLVQEALANVARHAQAKSVLIGLEKKEMYVCLSVTDDGKGFDARRCFAGTPRGSLGLFRMREQVEMMGGKFFIDSGVGKGTRLSIKLPLLQRSGAP